MRVGVRSWVGVQHYPKRGAIACIVTRRASSPFPRTETGVAAQPCVISYGGPGKHFIWWKNRTELHGSGRCSTRAFARGGAIYQSSIPVADERHKFYAAGQRRIHTQGRRRVALASCAFRYAIYFSGERVASDSSGQRVNNTQRYFTAGL